MNVTVKQAELAKTLFQIEDVRILEEIALSIEQTILKYQRLPKQTPKTEVEKLLELAKQPTPKHIPLEVLAKEQRYSSKKLGKTLRSFDHTLFADEDLEDMLNTLTK